MLGLVLTAAFYWRYDILRTTLDPKVPFQTYDPPPAPNYADPAAWALLQALYAAPAIGDLALRCGLLVVTGVVAAILAGLVGIALTWGALVTGLVYAFEHHSGAQFNPAVTIALWSVGRVPAREVIPSVIAQVLGAKQKVVGMHSAIHRCGSARQKMVLAFVQGAPVLGR